MTRVQGRTSHRVVGYTEATRCRLTAIRNVKSACAACHVLASLLSVARLGTANTAKHVKHQAFQRSLALSQSCRTNGGRPETHACRNTTSLATVPATQINT